MYTNIIKKLTYAGQILLCLALLLGPGTVFAASSINIGDVVSATLLNAGEIDEYTFTANDGERLYFDAQTGKGNHGIVWILEDPAGAILFSTGFVDPVEALQLTQDGQYTLAFQDSQNRENLSYSFQIFAVPDPVDTEYTPGKLQPGTIASPGGIAQYSFDVTSGNRLYFDPELGTGLHNFDWQLFNPDGALAFSDKFNNPPEPLFIDQDGRYSLQIKGQQDHSGDFSFTIYPVPDAPLIPLILNQTISNTFDVPGINAIYTFTGDAGQKLYFDARIGFAPLGYLWKLLDPNGTVIAGSSIGQSSDIGPVSLTDSGNYQLFLDARGDRTGLYSFYVYDVPNDPPVQNIAREAFIYDAIAVPGQQQDYLINGSAGETLYLHLATDSANPRLSLTAPDGSKVFDNVTRSRNINFTQDGEHTLRMETVNGGTGAYSFILSDSSIKPALPATADLIVSNVVAPTRVTGNPASFDVSWTVTNQGAVSASSWTDSIIISLGGDSGIVTQTDKLRETLVQDSHSLTLAPGESYTHSVPIKLADNFNANFEISVDTDVDNQVFEEQESNNTTATGFQTWVHSEERILQGKTTIQSDQEDASHYPAGIELSLSGQVQLFPGAINTLFILDVSASTKLVTGLDANYDGNIDLLDDLNKDASIGDILDAEIGAVLNLVNSLQSKTDDLLLANLPFAGNAWPIDSGTYPFSQVFVDPQENLSVGARLVDFEEALRSAYVPSDFISGAKLFNNFLIKGGTDFQDAIIAATDILENAPAADRTLVYMLTDGESTATLTQTEIDNFAALGISLFIYQIGAEQISAAVDTLVNAIDASADSSAVATLVEDPGDLSNALAGAIELAGVTVNGRAVQSLDATGHYFTPVQIVAGENKFVIAAIDSNGHNTAQTITLFGDESSTNSHISRDLSGISSASFSNTRYDRHNKQLLTEVHLGNVGQHPQTGPFNAIVQPIIPADVQLNNPTGYDNEGIPFINFTLSSGNPTLQVGEQTQDFELQMDNPAERRFSIVLNPQGSQNNAPLIHSTPPTSIASGVDYLYPVLASDEEAHTLIFRLIQSPQGMLINSDTGQIEWMPGQAQIGSYAVEFEVEDGFGGHASQRYQLSVLDGSINLPPFFLSSPPVSLNSGADYSYNPQVFDPNGDTLSFSLDTAPPGFVIDPGTGKVSRAKPADGDYHLLIRADDQRDGQAVQAFSVTVGGASANPGVPFITSTPSVESAPGSLYQYQPLAIDPDGDLLSYSLQQAPTGMQIDPVSGRISWTADSTQLGHHAVLLKVADSGNNFATQFFTIDVSETLRNLPPAIISLPVLFASEGSEYSYQVTASDPDGDPLSFKLVAGPAGMHINLHSGLLSYSPVVGQSASVQVRIQAQDPDNALAEQGFMLEIRAANLAPVFISTPVVSATAGATYRYAAKAEDSEDQLSYSLVNAPAGMSIDLRSGLLLMNPELNQLGDSLVTVRATDERGLYAEQAYTLSIATDMQAPVVSVLAQPAAIVNIGNTLTLQVSAVDNVDSKVAALSLAIDGSPVTLDASGKVDYAATASGLFKLYATATDSSNNIGMASLSLRVIDPADQTPPLINIDSPVPASVLEQFTDVTGTVTDDKQLAFYRLEVASMDSVDLDDIGAPNAAWQLLSEQVTAVNNGLLGRFDASSVRNDSYILRISAEDVSGNINIQALQVDVSAAAKLGRLTLELQDLEIPQIGPPIRVYRRYDSFDANNSGDFGYGWRLAFADPDIRTTVPLHPQERVSNSGLVVNPVSTGTRVYLNDPDGNRIGFTFEPTTAISLLGQIFLPSFTADPGVFDRLEVDPVSLKQNADGSFHVFPFGLNYNPVNYRLLRKDGSIYHYNKYAGLQRISDRNGNEISFDATGIHNSDGTGVSFIRDTEGRISSIVDSAQGVIDYAYDAAGNLISITDQSGTRTAYSYYAEPEHYLKEIIDARGNAHLVEYDSSGKISGFTNPDGNSSTQHWDSEHFSGTITDALGHITQLTYDPQGNLIESTDPLGNTTHFEYDSNNQLIAETNPLGNTRQFAYDADGNNTLVVDPLGNKAQFEFDAFGQLTRVTNAHGISASSHYDSNGNLTQLTLPGAESSDFSYDSQGRLLSFSDFRGNMTRYQYTGNSAQPSQITDAEGNNRQYEYNYLGKITKITDADGALTLFKYDPAGRLIETIDPLGNSSSYTFVDGMQVAFTNPLGESQSWEYDAAGMPITFFGWLGERVSFGYDAIGNRTSVTDPLGNHTQFAYDAMNQLISETDQTAAKRSHQYDSNGNRIRTTDRNGRLREFVYDPQNQLVEEYWYQGNVLHNQISSKYDALGRLTSISDNNSQLSFDYDDLNRITQSDNQGTPDVPGHQLNYHYDGNDNIVQIVDNQGVQINSVYDLNDRLLTRTLLAATTVRLDLAYNAEGQRAELKRSANIAGNPALAKTVYQRDVLGRMTGVEHRNTATDTLIASYINSFDAASRLTSTEHHAQHFLYRHDAAGQLIEAERSLFGNENFAYDAAGNPDEISAVIGAGNQLLENAEYNMRYDLEGNLIEKSALASGDVSRYGYDHLNRLISAEIFDRNGGLLHQSDFIYDAKGRRILRKENGTITSRVYNGENPWLDHRNDKGEYTYYMFTNQTDELIAHIDSLAAPRWYLNDHLGTTYDLIENSANVVNHLDYNSFGALREQSNPDEAVSHMYTGREFDASLNLYHYRARTYDPGIRRFTSMDPIGFDGGDYNLYRYVANSPQNATDPSGLSAVEYNNLICNISIPAVKVVSSINSCVADMFMGITHALETLQGNTTLVKVFGECVKSRGGKALIKAAAGHAGKIINGLFNPPLPIPPLPSGRPPNPADVGAVGCYAKKFL